MLFNSIEFIFAFLPLCIIAFYIAARFSKFAAILTLTIASLIFYSYWNPKFVALIGGSIIANYYFGKWIRGGSGGRRKLTLAIGVSLNLLTIAYFKYYNFFIDSFNGILGSDIATLNIFLPLGISFFTFQQIAFLVDSYYRKADESDFVQYAWFVSFFPQLIAGPIVHHAQVIPQLSKPSFLRFDANRFTDGLIVFVLGLAKKVILADQFAAYADVGFAAAEAGQTLTFMEAWGCALAYTFQLYFDFSGYSDMAIGLARMLNIELPLNFNSPYKATSIIDFWRRWHITLSTFLRDYLYIPLGGNRLGSVRRLVNLMLTMLIGGLWHGAGWTFVIWGGLHGAYLVLNHLWLQLSFGRAIANAAPGKILGWLVTFTAVVIAWVVFRATSMDSAMAVYRGMAGLNGFEAPQQILNMAGPLKAFFSGVGNLSYFGDGTVLGFVEVLAMMGIGLFIVLFTPNLHESSTRWRAILFVFAFALTVQKVLFSEEASPFLYFQF